MKTKVFYDNSFIKVVFKIVNSIGKSNYYAIMLFGMIFTKYHILSEKTINHEKIHVAQYWECFALPVAPLLFLATFFGGLWWLLLLLIPFLLYYVIYIVEYIVLIIKYKKKGEKNYANKAYKNVSFEKEAYDNQDNLSYIEDRWPLSWFTYFKIKN